jgi:hypothetical protein
MREALQQLTEETAKAVSAPLWPVADGELVDCLEVVHRWEQTTAALKARLTREIEVRGLPREHGHRTLAAWLRSHLRMDPAQARELADRAELRHRRPAVEQALADGSLDARQAAVIAAAVGSLSGIVDEAASSIAADAPSRAEGPAAGALNVSGDPEIVTDPNRDRIIQEAESVLIGMAAHFPAYLLRRLGDRILAHVAPEIADRADEAALRRQEARAHANRNFTLAMPIDGMVRVSGLLDIEGAATVAAALDPLCTPTAGDDRTAAQRRADALVDVCRLALRTTDLPAHGGEPPQMTVTAPSTR